MNLSFTDELLCAVTNVVFPTFPSYLSLLNLFEACGRVRRVRVVVKGQQCMDGGVHE